jgi:hypothetical protein
VENANTSWPKSNYDGEAGIISHPGAQGNGTGVGCGEEHHIKANKPMPYVNYYAFHIPDPDWGHITSISEAHRPFPAQVMANVNLI